tara:strand:+ start:339 stop:482 length:144 start_codon:yes stop_codon:yes gene_type:complete
MMRIMMIVVMRMVALAELLLLVEMVVVSKLRYIKEPYKEPISMNQFQ